MTFAVISFYTPNYKIGDHTKEVNTIYCKQHNYTYLSYSKVPEYLKDRHPAWCKLHYLLENMKTKTFDYVMWIDADAFFCNNDIKIEEWIDKAKDKRIIISRDPGYSLEQYEQHPKRLNSGVMIFKTCDENIELLTYMLHEPIFKGNYSFVRSRNQVTGETGWEQAAIRYCFIKNILNMKNSTYVNMDTNFNNNTNNVDEYIKHGGYIIHLTNFMSKFRARKMNTINDYKKKLFLKNTSVK